MRQFTEWMLDSDQLVDKDKAPAPVRDLPPYLSANFASSEDQIYTPGGEFAFCDALLISAAIQYYVFTGDRRPIEIAIRVADWNIANSTPAGAARPYLPSNQVCIIG